MPKLFANHVGELTYWTIGRHSVV